jgi:hypothetical protein
MTTILTIPQTDSVLRLIAVSDADARRVTRDPAMIDAVTVLGCVDLHPDDTVGRGPTGPRWHDVGRDIRDALAAAVQMHRLDEVIL